MKTTGSHISVEKAIAIADHPLKSGVKYSIYMFGEDDYRGFSEETARCIYERLGQLLNEKGVEQ